MKELTLELTQKCLNKCIYCSSNADITKCIYITAEKAKGILSEAKELGFTNVNFSGGEPFLHPSIIKLINYAKSLGFFITVYTSGVMLVNNKASSIPVSTLTQVQCTDSLVFNLQANDLELYEEITGKQHNFLNAVASLIDACSLHMHVELNFVPMIVNLCQFDRLVKACITLGVARINVLKLVKQGRTLENLGITLSDTELSNFLEHCKSVTEFEVRIGNSFNKCGSGICTAGKDKLVVRYDGQILSCERYKFKPKDSINIYESSLGVSYDYYNKLGVISNEDSI